MASARGVLLPLAQYRFSPEPECCSLPTVVRSDKLFIPGQSGGANISTGGVDGVESVGLITSEVVVGGGRLAVGGGGSGGCGGSCRGGSRSLGRGSDDDDSGG
ncbi:unnamed protein product [Clonostachys solani]|uniref:Uncharacterized protein n=1 Tax=Clonostachys solani TaxID=160281 RepID=A0A9P0EFZ5_9HYPO|nr:unnamed protein product [Clonostachys solani]